MTAQTRPKKLGPQARHVQLVRRMVKATGTDLCEVTEDQRLSQEDWAGVVARCQGCRWTEGCKRWLDDPHQADATRSVPSQCENHVFLNRLAKK